MTDRKAAPGEWVEKLAAFLREQPGVSAVRIDPAAHKVAVATIGPGLVPGLEEKLAATIAAVDATLAGPGAARVPAGAVGVRLRIGFDGRETRGMALVDDVALTLRP